jgi:hypothetical protein
MILLCRNHLIDPEVPLDFCYAREKVVKFLCKSGIGGALHFQPFDAAVNHRNLGSHVAQVIMSGSDLFVGVFELTIISGAPYSALQRLLCASSASRNPSDLLC